MTRVGSTGEYDTIAMQISQRGNTRLPIAMSQAGGSQMPDYVGQQLGSFQLIQMLGQGPWGSVYLGEHVHLRTQAAIKLLHGPWGEREVEGFLGEAATPDCLRPARIARVP